MKVEELIEELRKFYGEMELVFPAHRSSNSFVKVYEGKSPHTGGAVAVRVEPSWRQYQCKNIML